MTSAVRRAPLDRHTAVPRLVAIADAATGVIALLALSTAATGGFRETVLGVPVSLTSVPRLLALLAVVIVARHAWRRTPGLPQRAWDGWRAWRQDPVTRATWPVVVTTRVGVLVLGLLAVHAIGYSKPPTFRASDHELVNLPARFDAGWYLSIASEGYVYRPRVRGQQNLVFFPAFPALMSWVSLLMARQWLWAGVLVSFVAFAWAMRYLFRLAREALDADRAAMAVTLAATYPFAVFYSAAYTEALFLLAMLGAWWHLRRDERWTAFAWGFVAGLTRPNGCLLSVPLACIAVAPYWKQGRFERPSSWWALVDRLVVASAPGLAMLAYSGYIYELTGDPFTWIRLQATWGRENLGFFTALWAEWQSLVRQGLYGYVAIDVPNTLNGLGALLTMAAVVPVWRRFGVPAALVLVLNLVPSIASGGFLSVGRATSVLFPMFLWLADAVPARHRTLWVAGFAALQAFGAALFFTWRGFF
ncbi:MAG: mannosyltransferase family protein [Vicinamibacterales bacterium]